MSTLFAAYLHLTMASLVLAKSLNCIIFTAQEDMANCAGKRLVRAAKGSQASKPSPGQPSKNTTTPQAAAAVTSQKSPTRPSISSTSVTKAFRKGQNQTAPVYKNATTRNPASEDGYNVTITTISNVTKAAKNPTVGASKKITVPPPTNATLTINPASGPGANVSVPFAKYITGGNFTVPVTTNAAKSLDPISVTSAKQNRTVPPTKSPTMTPKPGSVLYEYIFLNDAGEIRNLSATCYKC